MVALDADGSAGASGCSRISRVCAAWASIGASEGRATRRSRVRPGAPSSIHAFDLLHLDSWDLLAVPLEERKRLLQLVLREHPSVRYVSHVLEHGEDFQRAVTEQGLEGSVAKLRREPLRARQADRDAWLKIKARREQELVLVGYEPGKGSHRDLGAAARGHPRGRGLALRRPGRQWHGRRHTQAPAAAPRRASAATMPPTPGAPRVAGCRAGASRATSSGPSSRSGRRTACCGRRPTRVARWVAIPHGVSRGGRADLVGPQAPRPRRELGRAPGGCARKRDGSLAVPSAGAGPPGEGTAGHGVPVPKGPGGGAADRERGVGRRPAGAPAHATGVRARPRREARGARPWRRSTRAELAALSALGEAGSWEVGGHVVELTNLDKVLFPAARYTKRDLVRYYTTIAPAMLPYLRERPLNVHRWPDGVTGRTRFWQKQIPSHAPDWVARWDYPEAGHDQSHTYVVADRVATMAWLANQAAIDLHPWTSRLPEYWRPTYALVDIDPGERTTWPEVADPGAALSDGTRAPRRAGLPQGHRQAGHPGLDPRPAALHLRRDARLGRASCRGASGPSSRTSSPGSGARRTGAAGHASTTRRTRSSRRSSRRTPCGPCPPAAVSAPIALGRAGRPHAAARTAGTSARSSNGSKRWATSSAASWATHRSCRRCPRSGQCGRCGASAAAGTTGSSGAAGQGPPEHERAEDDEDDRPQAEGAARRPCG